MLSSFYNCIDFSVLQRGCSHTIFEALCKIGYIAKTAFGGDVGNTVVTVAKLGLCNQDAVHIQIRGKRNTKILLKQPAEIAMCVTQFCGDIPGSQIFAVMLRKISVHIPGEGKALIGGQIGMNQLTVSQFCKEPADDCGCFKKQGGGILLNGKK